MVNNQNTPSMKSFSQNGSTFMGRVKNKSQKMYQHQKEKPIIITTYVDANLMHDVITGRSVSGIIHMLNKTPIEWFCKRQNQVETATYGSEFMAMHHY